VDFGEKIFSLARNFLAEGALFVGERYARRLQGHRNALPQEPLFWEQIARVASGIALAVFVLLQMPAGWIAYTLAACGLAFALTGAFGWCPACATVGRRLKERQIS